MRPHERHDAHQPQTRHKKTVRFCGSDRPPTSAYGEASRRSDNNAYKDGCSSWGRPGLPVEGCLWVARRTTAAETAIRGERISPRSFTEELRMYARASAAALAVLFLSLPVSAG